MTRRALALAIGVLLAGCMHEPIHQGNVLDRQAVFSIHEGMTRFAVEQRLGTPVLKSTLHPDRVSYVEEFEDEDGRLVRRGIEIEYDAALRVRGVHRFGWKEER